MSLLPTRILYIISNIIRWILFDVAGYRKEVVRKNFSNSFPKMTEDEINNHIRRFEQSFCDQWIETLKLLSISKKSLSKRIECDWTLFHQYANADINCIALLGHQFNWEIANLTCQLEIPQKFAGMYLPLKSKVFNRLILKLRNRFDSIMIDATNLRSSLSSIRHETFVLGLLADQSPANLQHAKWYQFLNQPCAFMLGPAKQARLLNTAVVFCETIRVSRGKYQIKLHEITKDARSLSDEVIIDNYVALLQKSIQSQPFNWLWTHKRWKHSPKPNDVIYEVPQSNN